MPKKQPRNAFYMFAQNFKEEQRKKGIIYANMAELMSAAGPPWTQASPAVRSKFEALAKQEKQKYNVPEMKFTSTGKSIAQIQQEEKERELLEQAEIKEIRSFVKLNNFDNRILDKEIYLMDVNYYCIVSGSEYLFGEYALLRFNVSSGILDTYNGIYNPGTIPLGYTSDVVRAAEELALPIPDESSSRTNNTQTLATIVQYLKQSNKEAEKMPPIYTMPDKVKPVKDFLQQLCNHASEDDSMFRVFQLQRLFFTLACELGGVRSVPRETIALTHLQKDLFKYSPRLGCESHEASERPVQCAAARVKRWAYSVLDICCPAAEIRPVAGQHLPPDHDFEKIEAYREESAVAARSMGRGGARRGPAAAAGPWRGGSWRGDSADNTLDDSALASSFEAASLSSSADQSKQRSSEVRMPKTNYAQQIRAAPQLTEAEFPALSSRGRGRGYRQ